jgi:hypothetical protein
MRWNASALAYQRRRLDLSKIPAIAKATRRAGIWTCPAQSLMEPEEFTSSAHGILSLVQLEARRQLIRALQDSGAGVLLGSDAGGAFGDPTVHTELQALVRAGLTPYEALLTGSRNMAQYFGLRDTMGGKAHRFACPCRFLGYEHDAPGRPSALARSGRPGSRGDPSHVDAGAAAGVRFTGACLDQAARCIGPRCHRPWRTAVTGQYVLNVR